ncbi:hypothetical protein Coch_2080 [Capnocytophaga ochracea DSM 7271]|uniref:Uncharacterized protein n=1 Tax=Capnocytophaga ochracea (strain ATCC 27872 / DSM 7271 / CCUG 9716 / JCM 12966 / NCTC 12371 / SS31 / VPI 2845) TaxID=521097 RepID=C7M3J8_CAPOD|nr:hypothetical protein [Capnocytophaga ochracea]ACU93624.1 hypothetical protein Coch_2080 [Capnocytophaga ochracea DSM 7271]UAK50240.1 hypothetical protein K8O87_05555 [Capnocytophaga ochracea]
MGYHIINITEKGFFHHFFEDETELLSSEITITENSIIYQGDPTNIPIKLKESKFKNYSQSWFIAGLRAQELFKNQGKENGLILEQISQDQKSFEQYIISKIPFEAIKRGDFLVRNYGNIEIEVKCKTFYKKNNQDVFYFNCNEFEKHFNMQKIINSPVIIAIYKRENNILKEDNPYFISINEIYRNIGLLKKEENKEINTGESYLIPLSLTVQSFDYIKNFDKYNEKSYSVEKIREAHPNAYAKWAKEDDDKLELLYCEKTTVKELCDIFGRNRGAILSRIKKLELREKYDI